MKEDGPQEEDVTLARARGRRIAHAIVLVVAVLFIVDSAVQIVDAVFAIPRSEAPLEHARAVAAAPSACTAGISLLAHRLDPGLAQGGASVGVGDPIPRAAMVDAEFRPSSDVARACAQTPGGLDAWAALQRLRVAQEQLARRSRGELETLRNEVAAHLPSELR